MTLTFRPQAQPASSDLIAVNEPLVLVAPKVHQVPRRKRHWALLVRTFSPIALLALWWVLARSSILADNSLPTPWAVFVEFKVLITQQDLFGQIKASLTLALTGLAIGVATGLALGILAGLTRVGEEVFDAPVQMIRTIPFLALTPLFIVWLGIGQTPKIVLIALATTFPVYLNTSSGVRNVDRKIVESARTFGLSGVGLVRQVVVPLAMPSILTGLRYALGISVLALVAAEGQLSATQGIGYLMTQAQSFQQTTVLFCCVIVYALLGLTADLIVRLLERVAMPWRAGVAVR